MSFSAWTLWYFIDDADRLSFTFLLPPLFPVLISHLASVDVRVQELCESRGGRPGLSVLMSLTVSVDVKQH